MGSTTYQTVKDFRDDIESYYTLQPTSTLNIYTVLFEGSDVATIRFKRVESSKSINVQFINESIEYSNLESFLNALQRRLEVL